MKVAVSIPDEIFEEAEALAKRLKCSRSEIYSRALDEFIGHHTSDRITDLMNDVVMEISPEQDAFVLAAARQVLKKTESNRHDRLCAANQQSEMGARPRQ